MRTLNYLFIFMISALLISCDNDDDDDKLYYHAYGVGTVGESTTKILTDDENVLFAKNLTLKEGENRIYTIFTLENEADAANDTAKVYIERSQSILFKEIATEEAELGDDPVIVDTDRIWNSNFNHTVTIPFQFYGSGNTKHFINLYHNVASSNADTVALEFRHNAYGEPETYQYDGLVSFDLTSIEDLESVQFTDSIVYQIDFNYINSSSENRTYYGVYKPAKEEGSSNAIRSTSAIFSEDTEEIK